MKVGIPRALLYYYYYPAWRGFFDALGVEIAVSPPTNKDILAEGVSRLAGETCLPAKIYAGHVLALCDQVDYILIPLIRRLSPHEQNCSRFLGLPNIIRAAVPDAPPFLTPEYDLTKGRRALMGAVLELGRRFTLDLLKLKRATDRAITEQSRYTTMLANGVTVPEAIHALETGTAPPSRGFVRDDWLTVGVVGHPYNLYDEYATHGLLRRLRALRLNVRTAESVMPEEAVVRASNRAGRTYWTYEHDMVPAAERFLADGVDGIIAIAAFACGPDAVLLDCVQKLCEQAGKPFLKLIVDEHTGEAGLVTRLEAFVDMLARRRFRRVI